MHVFDLKEVHRQQEVSYKVVQVVMLQVDLPFSIFC